MQQMIEVSVKEVDYFFIWLKEVYLILSHAWILLQLLLSVEAFSEKPEL